MNVDLAEELLNELGASLEGLETKHAALFQFLKDKGICTDEEIAPYLDQAGEASSVRWRAARIRLESLLRTERQKEEELRESVSRQASASAVQPSQNQGPEAEATNEAGSIKGAPQNEEAGADGPAKSAEKQPASDKGDAEDEPTARGGEKPNPTSNAA